MSFWANKLNGAQQTPIAPPSRDLYGLYQPLPTPPVQQQEESIPQQQTYTPTAKLTEGSICPGCGSDRYIEKIYGRVVSCPECGYNPAFTQTGYREGSITGSKGVRPARQSADRQTMDGAMAALQAGGGFHMHETQ